MNNSTDEYGCKLQEVFENERLVGSAIPLISDDLDSCFSRKSLLGNDPANWSAANGQECKFDADEDRTSPPVNPMPKGYVELYSWFIPKGWVYKKDFVSQATHSKYQLGSEVRFRIWKRVLVPETEKEAFLRDVRLESGLKGVAAVPPYVQFAFNLETVSKALAVHAKGESIQYRLQLVREYRNIRRKTVKTAGVTRQQSGLEALVTAGTDKIIDGLGQFGRKSSNASGITVGTLAASLANLTTNSDLLSQVEDEEYDIPVWMLLKPLPHAGQMNDGTEMCVSLPLVPALLALPTDEWTYVRGFNYFIDQRTDAAGWQYGATMDETLSSTVCNTDDGWSNVYDPLRKEAAHRVKRRTWCRILCTPKDSLTVTTFQQLLHSYHLRHPRGIILKMDQYKLGHHVKNWKKRRFVVTDNRLEFWKGDRMKGFVPLHGKDCVSIYDGDKYPCPSAYGYLIRDPVRQKYTKSWWKYCTATVDARDPLDFSIEHDCCYHPSWFDNIRNAMYSSGIPRHCLVMDGNSAENREELMDILHHHLWILAGDRIVSSGDDLNSSPVLAGDFVDCRTVVDERLPYSTSMARGRSSDYISSTENGPAKTNIDELLTSVISPLGESSASLRRNRHSDIELQPRPSISHTRAVSRGLSNTVHTQPSNATYYTGVSCLKRTQRELSYKSRFVWIGISSVANESARFYWSKGSGQEQKALAKFINISSMERIEQVKVPSWSLNSSKVFRRKKASDSDTQMTSGSVIVMQLPKTFDTSQIILQMADASEALDWVRELRKYMASVH